VRARLVHKSNAKTNNMQEQETNYNNEGVERWVGRELKNPMEMLPDEVLLKIFSYLEGEDLV
jgi:hypothetical protein